MTLKTAVLIPCYNEEKTSGGAHAYPQNLLLNWLKRLCPMRKFMFMTTIRRTTQQKSRHRPAQSSAACPSREKAALYAVCSQTLTLIFTLLRTET